MELALFTRGAYIWPVYRNFESFIAALGRSGNGAESAATDTVYPVSETRSEAELTLSPALDSRLASLHRELYDALLRPVEAFTNEQQTFAQRFWPDLLGTAIDDLMSAFFFYFIRQSANDISIMDGLNVLRAVFFNHEAVEPALWLGSSIDRVASLRHARRCRRIQLAAPADAKLHNLAFVIVADGKRPAGSPGWISGQIQRAANGLSQVSLEFALGPALKSVMLPEEVQARLDREICGHVDQVFGWQREQEVTA